MLGTCRSILREGHHQQDGHGGGMQIPNLMARHLQIPVKGGADVVVDNIHQVCLNFIRERLEFFISSLEYIQPLIHFLVTQFYLFIRSSGNIP
jgi:hypothetical protein